MLSCGGLLFIPYWVFEAQLLALSPWVGVLHLRDMARVGVVQLGCLPGIPCAVVSTSAATHFPYCASIVISVQGSSWLKAFLVQQLIDCGTGFPCCYDSYKYRWIAHIRTLLELVQALAYPITLPVVLR